MGGVCEREGRVRSIAVIWPAVAPVTSFNLLALVVVEGLAITIVIAVVVAKKFDVPGRERRATACQRGLRGGVDFLVVSTASATMLRVNMLSRSAVARTLEVEAQISSETDSEVVVCELQQGMK
jgi:hypothetical protein